MVCEKRGYMFVCLDNCITSSTNMPGSGNRARLNLWKIPVTHSYPSMSMASEHKCNCKVKGGRIFVRCYFLVEMKVN